MDKFSRSPMASLFQLLTAHFGEALFIQLFELSTYFCSSRRSPYLKEFLLVREAETLIIPLRKKSCPSTEFDQIATHKIKIGRALVTTLKLLEGVNISVYTEVNY